MLVLDWSHSAATVLREDDEFDGGADDFEEDAEYDEEDEEDEEDDYEYEEYDDYADKWDEPKRDGRRDDQDLKHR